MEKQSGVFVLPDSQSQGTLEDILLECAGVTSDVGP